MESLRPVVVFVRPQNEGNIGALARAMANFGCTELRLVGQGVEKKTDPDHAFAKIDWALAKKGQKVLSEASWHFSLEEAVADTHLVLGTSGRFENMDHSYARPFRTAAEGFGLVEEFVKDWTPEQRLNFRWALVMGPEHDGMNSQELACCHSWLHIPTHVQCPSMNIAVAAACFLYHAQEHFKDRWRGPVSAPALEAFTPESMADSALATFENKETFVRYLTDALGLTAFFKYPDQDAVRARLRRSLQGLRMPRGELLFWFEVIYQLKCWGQKKFEERNFLNRK